jgi:glucokinase
MTAPPVPVVEVGGTHVTAALVASDTWRVVAGSRRRRPLNAKGTAEEILQQIIGCANSLDIPAAGTWAVALPGPFDYARGVGLFEGVAKFEALLGVDVRLALMAGLRPPATNVVFVNDADAFVLGEWLAGAAAGHQRAAGITLGTGVGSAFLRDGVVVAEGPDVPPEGCVHLLTIGGRPLEDTVSRRAILARYAELAFTTAERHLDVREVAERARRQDVHARQALEEALDALGEALAPWLQRFGATVLVVGGSMAASWDLLAGPLIAGLTRADPSSANRMTVREAKHPTESALVGAARHAATSDHSVSEVV